MFSNILEQCFLKCIHGPPVFSILGEETLLFVPCCAEGEVSLGGGGGVFVASEFEPQPSARAPARKCRMANGRPVWRTMHANEPLWLYAQTDGDWCIRGELRPTQTDAVGYSRAGSGDASPAVRGVWWIWQTHGAERWAACTNWFFAPVRYARVVHSGGCRLRASHELHSAQVRAQVPMIPVLRGSAPVFPHPLPPSCRRAHGQL